MLSLALVLSACSQRPPGTPDLATRAVENFLHLLESGEGALAWAALTPATQQAAYEGNAELFAAEIADGEWGVRDWDVGEAVVSRDISWAVYVGIEGGSSEVPEFLVNRGIVAPWLESDEDNVATDRGILLLVQPTGPGERDYVIPGQGLDTEL